MLEKKRPEKIKSVAELEKTITEIAVASSRAIEPFVKVFSYSDENVTKSQLGVFFGVFEITDHKEDSAYIVNFLASVAKKEYFSNPRRGAIEGFEAALHKINVALSELVKHGNVAWLGKFHGAIGVLEKNNFHFSVTGQAKILLLRNEGLTEISTGLASEESDLHPLKTFVEVASGRMLPQDKIILTSPDIVELLPFDTIKKNALRMDNERFAQFLRTALINELPMAGTIVIDFHEKLILPQKSRPEEAASAITQNVFSEKAFVPKSKPQLTPSHEALQTPPPEYIDSKTGHIYVQGDAPITPSGHPSFERIRLSFQEVSHRLGSFFTTQKKLLRKGGRHGRVIINIVTTRGIIIIRNLYRSTRRYWKKQLSARRQKKGLTPQKVSAPLPSVPEQAPLPEHPAPPSSPMEEPLIPNFMKEKLATFYHKNRITENSAPPFTPQAHLQTPFSVPRRTAQSILQKILSQLRSFRYSYAHIIRALRRLAPHNKPRLTRWQLFALGIIIILFSGTGIALWKWRSNHPPILPAAQAPIESSQFPLDIEKSAVLLPVLSTLSTKDSPIITTILLDNDTYLITETTIINVREEKEYFLPAESGSIILATPMDDLRLLFLYTDTHELFAWSPINHTFTRNTLSLPEGAVIKDVDTYLTYLYVLDITHNQVYRFPRAEGGFGAATFWMRDPVTFESDVQMAVNETIFIAPTRNIIQAFFRGRFVRDLELPTTPLTITYLFTRPGLAYVYALDTNAQRILVWNQDGVLIAQYFSEVLANAQSIVANEKTGELFVTTAHSLLSTKIPSSQ